MKWMTRMALMVCLATAGFAQTKVGKAAEDLRITDSSGKTWRLSGERGKVVVMQFLYTTCVHCQATARMLSGLAKELGPKGLRVVGVAFDPGGKVDEFVKTNAVDFPVGQVKQDDALGYLGISILERYVVPQIVIVDRRGVVRAQSAVQGTPELQDPNYLRTFLGGLLKEGVLSSKR